MKRFPPQDELGTRRTNLVSPKQPVLCTPIRPTNTTVLTIRQMMGNDTVTDPGMHNERPRVTTMKASNTSALADHEHVHNVETRFAVPKVF